MRFIAEFPPVPSSAKPFANPNSELQSIVHEESIDDLFRTLVKGSVVLPCHLATTLT